MSKYVSHQNNLIAAEELLELFERGRGPGRPRVEDRQATGYALTCSIHALDSYLRQQVFHVIKPRSSRPAELERLLSCLSFCDPEGLQLALRILGCEQTLDELAADIGRPDLVRELASYADHLGQIRAGGGPKVTKRNAAACHALVRRIIDALDKEVSNRRWG